MGNFDTAACDTELGKWVLAKMKENNPRIIEDSRRNHCQVVINFIRNNDKPMTQEYVMSDLYLYDVATSTIGELQSLHAVFKNYISLRRCKLASHLMKRFQTIINLKYNNTGFAGLEPCYYNKSDVQHWFDIMYDNLTIDGKIKLSGKYSEWEDFLQFFMMFCCAPRCIGAFVFGKETKRTQEYASSDFLCKMGPENPDDERYNYIDLDKMVFTLNHYKTKGKHGGFNSKGYGKYHLDLNQFNLYNIFKLDMKKVLFLLEGFKKQYYTPGAFVFKYTAQTWGTHLKKNTILAGGTRKERIANDDRVKRANAVYRADRRKLREKFMEKAENETDGSWTDDEYYEHLIEARLEVENHYDEIDDREAMVAINNNSIRKHLASHYISESRLLKHLAKDMAHSIGTHVGFYLLSKGYDAKTAQRKAGDISKSMTYEDIDDYTESELSDE
jgi:hypothetical protein